MRYLGTRLVLLVKVGAGVGLAIAGLLMVTDQLSLRRVLAETGPEVVRLLVLRIHREIEHSGAQVVELAGALVGVVLIALTIRGYLRVTRGGQRA